MARALRIQYENAFYHAISRGNEKKAIFYDRKDHEVFILKLKKYCTKFDVLIHSFCLMENHFHLLMQTKKPNISKFMKNLLGEYSMYFNKRHNRVGHLFQGRYKSFVISADEYLLELSRYIHLNPCNAGIVSSPELYEWSSMQYFLSKQSKTLPFLEKNTILARFKSVGEYYGFVLEGMNKEINPFENAIGGVILGSQGFIEKIKDQICELDMNDITGKKEIFDAIVYGVRSRN